MAGAELDRAALRLPMAPAGESPVARPASSGPIPDRAAGAAGRYRVETWGCQMNRYDSERLAGIFGAMGLVPADGDQDADVIVLNTCSVRERSEEKLFSRLGRIRVLKLANPRLLVGVAGCVAKQEDERILARARVVDFVLGPGAIASLPDLMARAARGERPVDTSRNESYDELWPIERQEKLRAYVTVMEGCNKSCSFCVVPFTRGPEVNRAPQAIEDEVRRALEGGAGEVQLLGQNVNAYQHGEIDFAALLAWVDRIPGVGRVRFATSHPRELTDRVIDAMADCAHVCNYLHLPVQSGSNAVLKRMYRGYDRERYLSRVNRLRARRQDMALSTDIIVGFPGETEDEFGDTLRLLDEVDFDQVFAFLYSPRPFTAAAQLPDPVPNSEKEERLQRLFARQDEISLRKNRALEGRVVEVLVEGRSPREATTQTGRTTDNRIVHFAADRNLTGELVQVRLLRAHAHSISGELPV